MKRVTTICVLLLLSRLCFAQAWGEGGFDANKDSSVTFYYKNSNAVKKKVFFYKDKRVKAIEYFTSIDNPNPTQIKCFYENGKMKEYHSKKAYKTGRGDKVVDIFWDDKGAKKKTTVFMANE
ncbi:MAG TPA: hypothetical protein VK806_08450 [Bacteroidia bacterium]|jgi:hypothetical protein|nr:hypothetical protein [Bacteroidia bacterium]